jgi:hypothetical protein
MVSDVLGVPLDDALFARWTPVAQVYGFDTMSETRIDAQGIEEQLATAEALAEIVLATPALTAHCPAPRPPQTPACTLKPVYSAADDFSDSQGRDCWTYLDSDGVPMIFDNTRALWRKEPDQNALLWRIGAHPGSTVDAVRRWISPVDGTVAGRSPAPSTTPTWAAVTASTSPSARTVRRSSHRTCPAAARRPSR